jgi:hypothetical protein
VSLLLGFASRLLSGLGLRARLPFGDDALRLFGLALLVFAGPCRGLLAQSRELGLALRREPRVLFALPLQRYRAGVELLERGDRAQPRVLGRGLELARPGADLFGAQLVQPLRDVGGRPADEGGPDGAELLDARRDVGDALALGLLLRLALFLLAVLLGLDEPVERLLKREQLSGDALRLGIDEALTLEQRRLDVDPRLLQRDPVSAQLRAPLDRDLHAVASRDVDDEIGVPRLQICDRGVGLREFDDGGAARRGRGVRLFGHACYSLEGMARSLRARCLQAWKCSRNSCAVQFHCVSAVAGAGVVTLGFAAVRRFSCVDAAVEPVHEDGHVLAISAPTSAAATYPEIRQTMRMRRSRTRRASLSVMDSR